MTPRDDETGSRSGDRTTTACEQDQSGAPVPLRPTPPLAKRLNRNALTVAAALAGITVITVLVVTRPTRNGPTDGGPPSGVAPAPVPARPAFLDQPPKPTPLRDSGTARGEIGTSQALSGSPAQGGAASAAGGAAGPGGTLDARVQLPVPPPISESTSVLPAPGAIASVMHDAQAAGVSPRYEAYQSALTSSVIVGGRDDQRSRLVTSSTSDADPLLGVSGGSTVVPRPVFPSQPSGSSPGDIAGSSGSTPGPAPTTPTTVSPASPLPPTVLQLEPAGSPFTIRAGTVIAGFLVTGINSDLPGEVLGQTSRDVFDSETQHTLLVPKGSRLIGAYDSRSVGTGRLIVAWTSLILPDGRSMTLPRLAGTDVEGQAGLHDEVDHHYGRVYGAALLTSALTAGVQLSQPQQSGLYAVPSTRQVAAGALGQTMGDVALESARRGLDVPPTVVIRPGQPFDVFLAGDLSFPSPYRAEYAAGP
jgi:type IV secretory pathway VirB10-like protein